MLPILFFTAIATATQVIPIPSGDFIRGSGHSPDSPKQQIQLSAYQIEATEVSIAEFEQFVQEGWNQDSNWTSKGLEWRLQNPNGASQKNRAAGRPQNHPVVAVTWFEADAYCRWKGGMLPTEAQWERAACSENGRFPWGDDEQIEAAWYSGGKYGHLQAVLTKAVDDAPAEQRNEFGLFHTTGNVWEWTADWYHKDSYHRDDPSNPTGPETGFWKTLRGGSFMNLPSYCSCTHREPAAPNRTAYTVGFRCAYSTQ